MDGAENTTLPIEDTSAPSVSLAAAAGSATEPWLADFPGIRTEPAVRVLAGLETGLLGVFLMIGWVAIVSVWHGDPWYEVPNLWATSIWGRAPLYRHFGLMTLGGVSFQVVLGALIGAVFALIFGVFPGHLRLLLPGAITGIAWFGFFASRNRIFAVNAPQPEVLAAYILFGAALARVSRRGRVLQRALDAQEPPVSG